MTDIRLASLAIDLTKESGRVTNLITEVGSVSGQVTNVEADLGARVSALESAPTPTPVDRVQGTNSAITGAYSPLVYTTMDGSNVEVASPAGPITFKETGVFMIKVLIRNDTQGPQLQMIVFSRGGAVYKIHEVILTEMVTSTSLVMSVLAGDSFWVESRTHQLHDFGLKLYFPFTAEPAGPTLDATGNYTVDWTSAAGHNSAYGGMLTEVSETLSIPCMLRAWGSSFWVRRPSTGVENITFRYYSSGTNLEMGLESNSRIKLNGPGFSYFSSQNGRLNDWYCFSVHYDWGGKGTVWVNGVKLAEWAAGGVEFSQSLQFYTSGGYKCIVDELRVYENPNYESMANIHKWLNLDGVASIYEVITSADYTVEVQSRT
jgi:hypothetical protein